jgi:chorismate mutase
MKNHVYNTDLLLKPYRDEIDFLDRKIVELLVNRFQVIHKVAAIKAEHAIEATIKERVLEVINNATEYAAELSDDDDLIGEIYHQIVSLSCSLEDDIINAKVEKISASKG